MQPEPIQVVLNRVTANVLARAEYAKSEHDAQVAVVDWCAQMSSVIPELALLFAIPNGAKLPYIRNASGQRFSPQAQHLKAEGLRPGIPDLFLPVASQGYHGLFIELKFGRNKPSDVQVGMLDALAGQGYCAAVCWGAADAITTITEYLEVPNA